MNAAKNVALALLVVALATVTTLYWQQRQRIAELQLAVDRALEQTRLVTRRMTDTEERLATADRRRSELEAERKDERARFATTPAAGARANIANVRNATAVNALDNPNVQRMMTSGMRAGLDQRYSGLFRQLKLSPPELEKLKDLLTERQMSVVDAMQAARGQGLGPSELPALMSKVQDDVDQNIRSLIGDERFGRYQDFNQNQASYSLLDQIERRLSYTNVPLQTSQSDALLRVLIDTAPAAPTGEAAAGLRVVQALGGSSPMIASLTGVMGGGSSLSNDTISRAGNVLNSAQTDVLRQLQAEQQSQASMMQSMRANMGGAVNFSPAGATGTSGTLMISGGTPVAVPAAPPAPR